MDEKARKILLKTFWCAAGWKPEHQRLASADDVAYAKGKGVMFDPLSLSHDQGIERLRTVLGRLSSNEIAAAFLSSLSSRTLYRRSILGSYASVRTLPDHTFTPYQAPSGHTPMPYLCAICNQYGIRGLESYKDEDLNVLNFERVKWGGIRHDTLLYALFDLERFEQDTQVSPSPDDVTIFRHVLSIIEDCQPKDNARVLEKKLGTAKVFPSSKPEREQFLEILANAGILKAADFSWHAGGDWKRAGYWRGKDGVCSPALSFYFAPWIG